MVSFWSDFIYWGPSAVSPAPQVHLPQLPDTKLHPEDSLRRCQHLNITCDRCPRPPGHLPPHSLSLFQGSTSGKPLRRVSFSSSGQFRPPCGLAETRFESSPLLGTHLFSHGPGRFPPSSWPWWKQTAQLVLTETTLFAAAFSFSSRHITVLAATRAPGNCCRHRRRRRRRGRTPTSDSTS